MPDYKVYIPEAKAPILYQYKEHFGKNASCMVVEFMENSLTGKETAAENMGAEISRVYEIYFGDISDEREFIHLLGGKQSAETAINNRSIELYKKYPDIYLDVIAQFKEHHPNLAKSKGI